MSSGSESRNLFLMETFLNQDLLLTVERMLLMAEWRQSGADIVSAFFEGTPHSVPLFINQHVNVVSQWRGGEINPRRVRPPAASHNHSTMARPERVFVIDNHHNMILQMSGVTYDK